MVFIGEGCVLVGVDVWERENERKRKRRGWMLTGMTLRRFPIMPSLGHTYTTEQYRLPPAFSTHPTTRNTPESLATPSICSRVPSPLTPSPPPPPMRLATHSSPAPAPCPTVSPRSTAASK